jgi:DNA mismatch repair protein MutS2
MNTFIREANPHTLILIDEFGTGTDPKFGGPMAEAVLETLNKKNVKGVITTHYSNLKVFASSTQGLANASMLFDTVELKALYQLEIGQPGSSYAFEIAQKTGLSKQLIDLAKQKVGRQQQKVDDLLIEIQRDKVKLDAIQKELEADKIKLQTLLDSNKSLKAELDENKRRLLRDSKEEAKKILSQANKLIENTIAEIKNSKADKEITKKVRAELDQKSEELLNSFETAKPLKKDKLKSDYVFKIGDWVKIIDTETNARILNIQKNKVELAIGELRSFVNANKLEKIDAPKQEKTSRSSSNILNNSESFLPSIDIRGKRAEEALVEVEKFIDKALMMGFSQLRILHGKGDGILRKIIRESLRKFKEVKSIEDEHVDFGGDGISIVYL